MVKRILGKTPCFNFEFGSTPSILSEPSFVLYYDFEKLSSHTHISGMTPIAFSINTVSNWRDKSAFYRVVKLTYSRNFGKSNSKKTYQSSNEEKERLR